MRSDFISDNLVNIRDRLRENYEKNRSGREETANPEASSPTQAPMPSPAAASVVPAAPEGSKEDAAAAEAARLCKELRTRFTEEAERMRRELKQPQYFLTFLEDALRKLDAAEPLKFGEAEMLRVGYLHALAAIARDRKLDEKERTGKRDLDGLRFIELPPGRMAATVFAMAWPVMVIFLLGCGAIAGAIIFAMH